jgi:hypothetical protein
LEIEARDSGSSAGFMTLVNAENDLDGEHFLKEFLMTSTVHRCFCTPHRLNVPF